MKIIARANRRDSDMQHEVANTQIKDGKLKKESSGSIEFVIGTLPITLTSKAEYNFFISIDPTELDALYRFSMTAPIPPTKSGFKRRF